MMLTMMRQDSGQKQAYDRKKKTADIANKKITCSINFVLFYGPDQLFFFRGFREGSTVKTIHND